ncbi:MAG: LLM class flavin-dependent oxidoreductase [Chloroflexi bacterium]|nr:LLM class flavin-dependent oxidoreductase [Chloroflexota bacterium]
MTAPARPPIGVVVSARDAATAVDRIVEAERLGIPAAWMTTGGTGPDALTIFGAALARTERVLLGTCITPTWPRHPLSIAQQVRALEELAPGRFRLGIGPSHEASMVETYGVEWRTPLTQLREYVQVLKAVLQDGSVDFEGSHVTARGSIEPPPGTPVMASALQLRSFRMCGEHADGAISWNAPAAYLRDAALPALREGAAAAGREPPPLLAHVPICVTEDRDAVIEAGRRQLGRTAQTPFYGRMLAAAGFPDAARDVDEALIDALIVSGSEQQVAARLRELLDDGMGELLVMPIGPGGSEPWIERGFAAVARAAEELR